jgi:hypothetical protein
MARLVSTPTFVRLATRASNTANPAALRHAPIQSAASRTSSSVARPSPIRTAASKTLKISERALQQTLAAQRGVAAALSRVKKSAEYRTRRDVTVVKKDRTNCAQQKYRMQTRIPAPIRPVTEELEKLRKARHYKRPVYWKVAHDLGNNNTLFDVPAAEPEKEVAVKIHEVARN